MCYYSFKMATQCMLRRVAVSCLKGIFSKSERYSLVYTSNLLHRSARLLGIKGTELKMPSLSPTMTEGTIIKWLKHEGDSISPGDVLCEIQTDKAVVGFEVEEEGILAKILIPENTKDVKIGTIIGLIVEEGEDWKNVEIPGSGALPASQDEPSTQTVSHGGGVKGTDIKMPSLSPTMTEGTIVKWLKQEGDSISPGDVLCEVQTDKAVVGFEIEEEGILAKILVPENTKDIKIGTIIALMVDEGEDWKNVAIPVPSSTSVPKAELSVAETKKGVTSSLVAEVAQSNLHLIGPAVKNLLNKYGLQQNQITSSGPHSVLLKGDVLKYIEKYKVEPKVAALEDIPSAQEPKIKFSDDVNYIDVPHTNMRKVIAKRLTESKTTIPHVYVSADCAVDKVINLRKKLKNDGIIVSVNDFIIKAVALSLQQIPEVNVSWVNNARNLLPSIDVSVAVATDSGLITPIVKEANKLGVQQISNAVKVLAAKAREGKLQLHEFQGGSFSVSNLGMYGILEFSAVINPPQGAILSIGTTRALLRENGEIESRMIVTLSYDGRAIDDDAASRFLQVFKQHLEDPMSMIVLAPLQEASVS